MIEQEAVNFLPKDIEFKSIFVVQLFYAIYSLTTHELAKSTAYREHHKLQAESRSLKSWKSAIYAD